MQRRAFHTQPPLIGRVALIAGYFGRRGRHTTTHTTIRASGLSAGYRFDLGIHATSSLPVFDGCSVDTRSKLQ